MFIRNYAKYYRLQNPTGQKCNLFLLRLISQQTGSQAANRELATERFVELLRDAVKQLPISKKIK
jgi:hypothetical protein